MAFMKEMNLGGDASTESLTDVRARLASVAAEKFNYAKKEHELQLAYLNEEIDERQRLNKKLFEAELKSIKVYEKKKEQILAKLEKDKAKKGLSKEQLKQIEQEAKARVEAIAKAEEKAAKKAAARAAISGSWDKNAPLLSNLLGLGSSLKSSAKTYGKKDTALAALSASITALGNWATSLNSEIQSVAKQKSYFDTRLTGSKRSTLQGSYWGSISQTMRSALGASPLVSQSEMAANLKTLVGSGISYNLEQRAFLMTIKDKIAETFNAQDATLTKLIRIQQQDSTAYRLGMEASMNAFLNNMYETTEYLNDVASSVRESLYEAEALTTATNAVAFENTVQGWLGSLYSVGMSSSSVSSIASTLGKIASGDISGLTGGGTSNLLIMAANRAGLSLADIMADGLDQSSTNQLLSAMVAYLQGIYGETKNSRVVSQQLASVFGMSASDLKALSNLSSSDLSAIGGYGRKTSGGLLGNLYNMASSMASRVSIGEMLGNISSNFKYSMASGIGSNPALYAIYELATGLKDVTGGIDIPIPFVGNLNLANTMLAGALSTSFLSGIGGIISSLTSGWNGGSLLNAFGVGNNNMVARGTGRGSLNTSGISTSLSGYVGNSSSSDVYNSTLSSASESNSEAAAVYTGEEEQKTLTDVDASIIKIYNLLYSISNAGTAINVRTTMLPEYGGY